MGKCIWILYMPLSLSVSLSGMTIEVLGTVLGTAIQGQIVGGANAPCLNHTSFLNDSYNVMQLSSKANVSHVTLEDTVRVGGAKRKLSQVILAL